MKKKIVLDQSGRNFSMQKTYHSLFIIIIASRKFILVNVFIIYFPQNIPRANSIAANKGTNTETRVPHLGSINLETEIY